MHSSIMCGVPVDGDAAAVETLYSTGHWLFTQSRFKDAATVLRAMLLAAPTDERPWLALGECHDRLGHREVALELYATGAIAAAPAPLCHLAQFRSLFDEGDEEAADAAYEQALECAENEADDDLVARIKQERSARS